MSQNRWMLLNITIYFFVTFSHHFDRDKDNTYGWHGAFHPYVTPGPGQMEHGMLGQNDTSLGQNGTKIRGKMAYFNKRMRE